MSRQIAIGLTLVLLGIVLMGQSARADELLTTFYGGTDGYCGNITASGEIYDCGGYTAASSVYPLGTVLEICYNGCVVVRVNDVGPALDLSMAAASAIGIDLYGPAVTEVTVL